MTYLQTVLLYSLETSLKCQVSPWNTSVVQFYTVNFIYRIRSSSLCYVMKLFGFYKPNFPQNTEIQKGLFSHLQNNANAHDSKKKA